MIHWKATKLPVIGCSTCIGDTVYLGDKCPTCDGWGYFNVKKSGIKPIKDININITKSIHNGITN